MKVIRKQTIDTETFELGDEIRFKLTTGEKVRAKAVQECENGMLFITKDCVGKETPMYENPLEEHLDYLHSDLRKYLTSELLSLFPEKIRSRMLPMMIRGSYYEDYLRIPTEKEIFGKNHWDTNDIYTKQFYGMNHRRNRIATDGKDKLEWYWLLNNVFGNYFAYVSSTGFANFGFASTSRSVRVVFELSNGEANDDF